MDIPASCLFNKDKFKSFMDYLDIAGIVKPDSFNIVNDIEERGLFIEGAILRKNALEPVEVGHYSIAKQMDNSYKDVYIPSVGSLDIESDKELYIIEKLYVQPSDFKTIFVLSAPRIRSLKIFIRELHVSDLSHVYISGHKVNSVNIHSNKRAFTLVDGCRTINLNDAKKVIAFTSVENLAIIFQNTSQKIKALDREVMYGISKGNWRFIENKATEANVIHQDSYGNWFIGFDGTILHPEEIPDTVWRIMKREAKQLLNNNN